MIFIYDIKLVILSILIAVIAAYTALDLAGRVTASKGKTQKLWLIGGATVMGIGIWSMHFIGMLAYKLPIPIAYDLPTVVISLIVPIFASLVALYLVSRQHLTKTALFAGAIFMGFTIASMHYIGMAAMRMPAIAYYNPKFVILSVTIAITASLIALWLSFKLRQANTLTDILKKIGSALIMGTGIAGMHYTAMAAVTMQPSSQLSQPGTYILASSSLAVAIGITTFIILTLTLLTSLFERRLDLQRHKLAAMVESSNDAIITTTNNGIISTWNMAATELYGYSPSEAKGRHISFLTVPDNQEISEIYQPLEQSESMENFETVHQKKDGQLVSISLTVSAIKDSVGQIIGTSIIAHNITERQLAQQLLKQQAASLKEQAELLNLAHDAIIVRDLNNNFTLWNKGAEEIYGWTEAEALGKTSHSLLQTEFPQPLSEIQTQLLTQDRWEGELIHRKKDGTQIIVSSRWALRRDQNNQPLAILEINNDISEVYEELRLRKLIQTELEQERAFLNAVLENIEDGIVACNAQGNLTFFNRAAKEFHSIPAKHIPASQWAQHYSLYLPDSETLMEMGDIPLFRALKGEIVRNSEMVIAPKQGLKRTLLASGRGLFDDNGNQLGAVVSMHDITERKQAEQELNQLNQNLEIRVQQRTAELIKTNQELQNEIAERIQTQIALSQANQELKENALRFQSLVSNIPGAVYRCKWDDDWAVDFISEAIFNISGYPASDFINNCVRTYDSIIHPEDRENVQTVVQQALAQHQPYSLEYRIIHANGSDRWVYEQGQAHPSSSGNILWLDGAIFDISERKLAENQIKNSEERFRLLVEGVKDYAILMLDPQGYITTWNTGAERIKGYQAEEIIGQHFSRFYTAEDVKSGKPERILKAAIQQGRYEEEGWRVRKNGSLFMGSILITALHDGAGNLRGFSKVTRDITERKYNEEKLRKWADIFQHTSQGLVIATPGNECLELINPALAKMHGYTVEELIGRPFTDLLAPECITSVLERIHQSLSQDYYSLETKHIRKDKTVFYALVGVNNVRDEQGKISYIITNIQDITQRKQAETEILNSLQKATELNELKSRFIAMTSHEFRTPLATILSSTELLEYYSDKLPESEKQDLFRQIEAAIKRMTQLLEDVLVINKAEAGKLEFNPVPINLESFCRELIAEMQLSAGNKHKIIFTNKGHCISAVMDEKLLHHILTNLLSNALKYSPDGKDVEFELSCHSQQAIFKIKDHGIGIPCEAHEKLFESFQRAKNVGNIQGTGLGLFITKKMVNLHQGSINFISKVGIGTTFTVNLPLHIKVSIDE
ncbi:MAG TPA: PAS domain S-box protein [Oculatellaceae cyanobacterium]|jgi:PAS domain S-box-containing protein